MTDADREIKRLISYIRSCREANIDCTVTIDKRLTHCVLNALEEVQKYREIGTVEEFREAVEKQTQKKCAIDSCPDHTHYKCPSCGQIELSIYKHDFPRLGRITKYCDNCGQALIDKSQKGMKDAVSND